MLFSEPKIPQSCSIPRRSAVVKSFSALQRAENSSILTRWFRCRASSAVSVLFSEPKIPQWEALRALQATFGRFSALQRAENSSIEVRFCSEELVFGFSALQRAENSSIGMW